MSRELRKPNFFIVDAPKCGTTAMADYLREHPDVFVCYPKEPNYWCEDMPAMRRSWYIESLSAYLALFRGARDCSAIGEASPLYLYSRVAIRLLYQFQPDCRLVALLRN